MSAGPRATRELSVSTFFNSFKEKLDQRMKKDEDLQKDMEETRRRLRESKAVKGVNKAAELGKTGAVKVGDVAGKSAKVTVSAVKTTARVTVDTTSKIADATGATTVARATARATGVVLEKSGAKKAARATADAARATAARAADTRAARETMSVARDLLSDTPYEEVVGPRDTGMGSRKKVELNTEVTALAGEGKETASSRVRGTLSRLVSSTGIGKRLEDAHAAVMESESPAAGVARNVLGSAAELGESLKDTAGRVSELLMPETENGKAIAAIRAVDPDFEPYEFVRYCKYELIPEVLAAQEARDMEKLEAMCSQKVISMLSAHWAQIEAAGGIDRSRMYDVRGVEFVQASLKEDGNPIVLIMFRSSGNDYIVNTKEEVITGDPDKVIHKTSVWALMVDSEEEEFVRWRVDEFTTHGVEGLI